MLANMKLRLKLFLAVAALLLPLLTVSLQYLSGIKRSGMDLAQKQLQALPVIRELRLLLEALQTRRSYLILSISGGEVMDVEVANNIQGINRRLNQIDSFLDPALAAKWFEVKKGIQDKFSGTQIFGFAEYSDAVANLLAFFEEVGAFSNLNSQTDLDITLLSQVLTATLPELCEYIARVRGHAIFAAAKDEINDQEAAIISRYLTLADFHEGKFVREVNMASERIPGFREKVGEPASLFQRNFTDFRQTIESLAQRRQGWVGVASQYFEGDANILAEAFQLFDNIYPLAVWDIKRRYQEQIKLFKYYAAFVAAGIIIGIFLVFFISWDFLESVGSALIITRAISEGRRNITFPRRRGDEFGALFAAIFRMLESLNRSEERNNRELGLRTFLADFAIRAQSDLKPDVLAATVLDAFAHSFPFYYGGIFLGGDDHESFHLAAGFARGNRIAPNSGEATSSLISQVAKMREALMLTKFTEDFHPVIASGFITIPPKLVYIAPVATIDEVYGVIELGFDRELDKLEMNKVKEAINLLGMKFQASIARNQLEYYLEKVKKQTKELQASNSELEEKSQELQQQQEELQQTNEELEQQRSLLEEEKERVDEANEILQKTQVELLAKTEELEKTGRYKSEFLATMSHELRSPLNSILILSDLLCQNKDQVLTTKQVEFAQTIRASGKELLDLINDILDLSKVEAGRLAIEFSEVSLASIAESLQLNFQQQPLRKGLTFNTVVDDEVRDLILTTDRQRLEQIVRNFLANALKFTDAGTITLAFRRPDAEMILQFASNEAIEIAVSDTGIGIDEENQELIFKAFHQVDSSTSRKHGGAGLGLAISRSLAHLLGGEIYVRSQLGRGSTFSLILAVKGSDHTSFPKKEDLAQSPAVAESAATGSRFVVFARDANGDTEPIARIIRKLGGEAFITNDEAQFTAWCKEGRFSGIILDLDLARKGDQEFVEKVCDLKNGKNTPVIVYSVHPLPLDKAQNLQRREVAAVIKGDKGSERLSEEITALINRSSHKPVPTSHFGPDRVCQGKNVLLVDDDMRNIYATLNVLEAAGLKVRVAYNGREALSALEENPNTDLVLMDMMMPEMDGYEATRRIRQNPNNKQLPVIALTAKAMRGDREKCIQAGANDYITKPLSVGRLMSVLRTWLQ